MKTKKQIDLTPIVLLRRSLTGRTAVASVAFATATIPVVAGGASGAGAHQTCPCSKATRGNIGVAINLV